MARIINLRIDLVTDFCGEVEQLVIANRRLREFLQSRPTANQHHRNTVRKAEFRPIGAHRLLLICQRFPEAVHGTFGSPADHFLNLIGMRRMLLFYPERAIHIGMRNRRARIRLERQSRYFPALPELKNLFKVVIVLTAERGEKTVRAFEHFLPPAKTLLRKKRRKHPAVRRPSGMEELRPGAVREILKIPRALPPAKAEGIDPLIQIQPIELARGGSGAEGR